MLRPKVPTETVGRKGHNNISDLLDAVRDLSLWRTRHCRYGRRLEMGQGCWHTGYVVPVSRSLGWWERVG